MLNIMYSPNTSIVNKDEIHEGDNGFGTITVNGFGGLNPSSYYMWVLYKLESGKMRISSRFTLSQYVQTGGESVILPVEQDLFTEPGEMQVQVVLTSNNTDSILDIMNDYNAGTYSGLLVRSPVYAFYINDSLDVTDSLTDGGSSISNSVKEYITDLVDELIAEGLQIDSSLSTTSMNAVQNKVVTTAIDGKADEYWELMLSMPNSVGKAIANTGHDSLYDSSGYGTTWYEYEFDMNTPWECSDIFAERAVMDFTSRRGGYSNYGRYRLLRKRHSDSVYSPLFSELDRVATSDGVAYVCNAVLRIDETNVWQAVNDIRYVAVVRFYSSTKTVRFFTNAGDTTTSYDTRLQFKTTYAAYEEIGDIRSAVDDLIAEVDLIAEGGNIDNELSLTSVNAVQNRIVTRALEDKADEYWDLMHPMPDSVGISSFSVSDAFQLFTSDESHSVEWYIYPSPTNISWPCGKVLIERAAMDLSVVRGDFTENGRYRILRRRHGQGSYNVLFSYLYWYPFPNGIAYVSNAIPREGYDNCWVRINDSKPVVLVFIDFESNRLTFYTSAGDTTTSFDTRFQAKTTYAAYEEIGDIRSAIAAKQDLLTWDNAPTANSDNPVKSSGIKNAVDQKADVQEYRLVDRQIQVSDWVHINPQDPSSPYVVTFSDEQFKFEYKRLMHAASLTSTEYNGTYIDNNIYLGSPESRVLTNVSKDLVQLYLGWNVTDFDEESGYFSKEDPNSYFYLIKASDIGGQYCLKFYSDNNTLPGRLYIYMVSPYTPIVGFDDYPERGSLNPVTSDGISRAIAAPFSRLGGLNFQKAYSSAPANPQDGDIVYGPNGILQVYIGAWFQDTPDSNTVYFVVDPPSAS